VKAVICTKYGPPDVLQLREVPKPRPKENEVLIKVYAASVTTADVIDRSSAFPTYLWPFARMSLGLTRPRNPVLGFELAGEIEATGRNVRLYKLGDKVFASTFEFGFGCYAQYRCLAEGGTLAMKPANMTYEEAATVPLGGLTALAFLRDRARIKSGQKVLVYGASSSVGTYAVQLAKYYGTDVTGVCSTANLEMVKSLGADAVVDYTKDDFTGSGETYDVIFDVVNKLSFPRCRHSLTQRGIYLATFPTMAFILQMLRTSLVGTRKAMGGEASEKAEDLCFLRELIEANKIRSVIDRRYPLDQTAEAHSYVEKGHKKGNVVLNVEHP